MKLKDLLTILKHEEVELCPNSEEMYDITVIEELVTDNKTPKSFEPYLDCEIKKIYSDCDYDNNGELMSFLSIELR